MIKNGDEDKNIFKDYTSGNKTKTNFLTKQKTNFSPEDRFRLSNSGHMNLFKEMKLKKAKNGLPPISMNKDDSNAKDMNFSSLFEEIKDNNKDCIPKVMKIVRKKIQKRTPTKKKILMIIKKIKIVKSIKKVMK